jgi:hypothetical protein
VFEAMTLPLPLCSELVPVAGPGRLGSKNQGRMPPWTILSQPG